MGQAVLYCSAEQVRCIDEVYVLRDNANWYCMDDWTRAEKFAGKRVSVTAALDPEGHMLHVRSIEESSK